MHTTQEDNEEVIILTTKKKKSVGPANKRKGSRVEREYANIFSAIAGLEKCKTTRFTSRILDNCKIDLNFLPILVQIKAGEQKGLNPSRVLEEMSTELAKHLPANYPEHTMPKIVVHHKDMPKGRKKRVALDSMVHLTFEDFMTIFLAFVKQQSNDLQTK